MVPAGIGIPDNLAVLCGPTAVGKTAVAVALAERLDAEVIAADSRTVYRGADIGTAKPTPEERRRVRHHLLDVVDPGEAFTLADYQRLVGQALAEIRGRGRLPLLVGGTGLYIRAVVDGFSLPPVPPDPVLRLELEADERAHGPGHLHARLATLDPVAAARLDPRNLRRIIRALEVILRTGRCISEQQRQHVNHSAALAMVGLAMERSALYRRIDARVEELLARGLEEETRRLLERGVPLASPLMQSLGYREMAAYLSGACNAEEAIRLLKRNTRRYAKRQLTWFRREARIQWLDVTGLSTEAVVERAHAIMSSTLRVGKEA